MSDQIIVDTLTKKDLATIDKIECERDSLESFDHGIKAHFFEELAEQVAS